MSGVTILRGCGFDRRNLRLKEGDHQVGEVTPLGGSHSFFVHPFVRPFVYPFASLLLAFWLPTTETTIFQTFFFLSILLFILSPLFLSFVLAAVNSFVYTFVHSFVYAFVHSFVHTFVHSFVYTFVHSFA